MASSALCAPPDPSTYRIMGLLIEGDALSWKEGRQHAQQVKDRGIRQFLNIWEASKDRSGDPFLWGDEVCYAQLFLLLGSVLWGEFCSRYWLRLVRRRGTYTGT